MREFVIAGGGIAGLAAAIALARVEKPATVMERAQAFEEVGAGLQVGPNAVRAIRRLGVWERLEPLLVRPRDVVIRHGVSGDVLSRVPLDAGFVARFGDPYFVVHRADLLAALLDECLETPGLELKTGHEVSDFEIDGGTIHTSLADGGREDCRVLIGADGVRSRVRKRLLNDGPPRYAGHAIHRALIGPSEIPDVVDTNAVTLWLYPGGHVVHYLVSAERLNVVAALDTVWTSQGWSEPGDCAEVLGHFQDAAPELRQVLEVPRSWLKWAAADRTPVRQWGAGPVSLIGDAAHPTLPCLAQGAAMALEDAAVLGQEMAAGAPIPETLRRYEHLRQARTAKLVTKSAQIAKVYHFSGALAAARDLMLRYTTTRIGYAQLAWLYDWGREGMR